MRIDINKYCASAPVRPHQIPWPSDQMAIIKPTLAQDINIGPAQDPLAISIYWRSRDFCGVAMQVVRYWTDVVLPYDAAHVRGQVRLNPRPPLIGMPGLRRNPQASQLAGFVFSI